MKSEKEGSTATVDEVRAQLNAEAEAAMNNTQPTPTQADLDAYKMGGHLDDKEEVVVVDMPPVVVQQALLAAAVPNEPPVEVGATAPPVNRDVPFVTGAGTVGSTLNCTMGNWENEPTNYSYAWYADGLSNSAVGADYVVVVGDVGKELTCIVTATNAAGSTSAPDSNGVTIEAVAGDARRGSEAETRTVPKR